MADRADRKHSYSDSKSSSDDPPNSRLFIICSKNLTEDDFRNAFSRYGEIEEIWPVRDRHTGERKGVTYIKYAKTSEAAAALEAMNGKIIGDTKRHIKVMIAASRDQGAKRDGNEEEKILRLFVIVPKSMTDDDLYNTFKVYGDVDYATIIKDKETRDSKGYAYIKYFKFSHAAAAFEQCDRKFKAVFAEPRKPRQYDQSENKFAYDSSFSSNQAMVRSANSSHSLPVLPDMGNEGYSRLQVIGSPQLNQDQLWKLFDIIPGMDYCQLRYEGRPRPVRSLATVVYSNNQAAAYALEKLHGFEYPPGSRLIVKPELDASRGFSDLTATSSSLGRTSTPKPDLLQLAETIAQATSIIQAAGLSPDLLQQRHGMESQRKNELVCNVKLPDPKPLANTGAAAEARCFIVCSPHPLPPSALKDIFCRFGNLIDVYMLQGRNCGYAKYTSKQSAENAINTLHGSEVCGVRLKVMEAEERDHDRKRQRLDDDSL